MINKTTLFDRLMSQVELCFSFFIKQYLDRYKADDIAGIRCLQLLISYHFELFLKAKFILSRTFSSDKEAIEALRKLGHNLEKIGNKIGKNGLKDIGIEKIYKIDNSYNIKTEDGVNILIDDFIDIRYEYLSGKIRNTAQYNDEKVKTNLVYIEKMIEKIKN